MNITELQAFIDTKPELREIINEIADYLQSNPGGGGNTIYTGDGSLAGNRTVDLNGKILKFQDNGFDFLAINDVGETTIGSQIGSFWNADGGNEAFFAPYTEVDKAYFEAEASFNGNSKTAKINGYADATESELEYTADTHTFNGAVITPDIIPLDFANDGAAATGGVAVGQWYHTSGALKLRLV